MKSHTLTQTDFPDIKPASRGKVRDIYDLGEQLLIVTTDRISAYDCILPNGIPGKGKILNRLSEFWFKKTSSIIDNHLISTEPADFPPEFRQYSEQLRDRSMLVRKTAPLPAECIVRAYLSGSGWNEYLEHGSVCGIKLPAGLRESDRLGKPIFTPSTKASDGTHDLNIDFSRLADITGKDTAERLKNLSLDIYARASVIALEKGVIIADTKMEFGTDPETGEIILIDELLTPDSSRFWLRDEYSPGKPQKSFDKQFVRDYLNSINWDRKPPAPVLPDEIVEKTRERYESIMHFFGLTVS